MPLPYHDEQIVEDKIEEKRGEGGLHSQEAAAW